MADKGKTVRDRRGKVIGYKGSKHGQRFASDAETAERASYQKFLEERGWAGIAGAAKRPPNAELRKQFAAWKKARKKTSAATQAKNAGQRKAVSQAKPD